MDRTELAWAAGFWDGEGSAWLSHPEGRTTAQPYARINQASPSGTPEVLVRFQRALGFGSLRGPELGEGSEPIYRWVVSSRVDVQQLLTALAPWLGAVKRHQLHDVVDVVADPVEWGALPSIERCAWAAGLWDGEGSVCLLKHRSHAGHFVPEASVTQSSADGRPEVLSRIATIACPGYWYGPFSQEGSRLPVYRWKLFRSDEIRGLLGALWPWLSNTKRLQAEAVFATLEAQPKLPRGNPAWGSH